MKTISFRKPVQQYRYSRAFYARATDGSKMMFDEKFDFIKVGDTVEFEYHTSGDDFLWIESRYMVKKVVTSTDSKDGYYTDTFNIGYTTKEHESPDGDNYHDIWFPTAMELTGIRKMVLPVAVVADWQNRLGIEDLIPSYGKLTARGRKCGDIFHIHGIERFDPTTKVETFTVPVKELKFYDDGVGFTVGDFKGEIKEDLPFDPTGMLEKVKDKIEGDVTITCNYRKTGHKKKDDVTDKWTEFIEWHYIEGSAKSQWSATSVDGLKVALDDFIRDKAKADLIAELKATVKYRPASWWASRFRSIGVNMTEDEILKLHMKPKYNMEFFDAMNKLRIKKGGEVMTGKKGDEKIHTFLFTIGDKFVEEEPRYGVATYVFRKLPQYERIETQLDLIHEARKMDIRTNQQLPDGSYVHDVTGYVGMAVHTEVDSWLERVKNLLAREVGDSDEQSKI